MKHHLTEGFFVGLFVFVGSSLEAESPKLSTINGMGGMGMMPPPEIARLNDPTEGQRPLAELLRDLKNKDLITRRKAAIGLYMKLPPLDTMAIPVLIDALHDKDSVVQRKVALALGNYGSQAQSAVPALMELIQKRNEGQLDAVFSLGQIGPEAHRAKPILVKMLMDKSYLKREAAAVALGKIGRQACTAIKALRKAIADHAPPVRVAAAAALWRISGSAQDSVPVLVNALQRRQRS